MNVFPDCQDLGEQINTNRIDSLPRVWVGVVTDDDLDLRGSVGSAL